MSSVLFRMHLAANALMACEVHAQRGKPRVVRKACFAFAGAQERPAALQSLREWIGKASRRAAQEWVLGIADVRHLLLPWAPDLADDALRSAFAAASFEQQFEQDPGLHAVRFAKPVYGSSQLAAFVPHSLLSELDEHADASGIRLRSIAPSLVAVWDRFHAVLAKEHGLVQVVEGDRQLVVRHVAGQMTELLLRPFDAAHEDTKPPLHVANANRRFFCADLLVGASDAALSLKEGDGFFPNQDAAYAFALCGVF